MTNDQKQQIISFMKQFIEEEDSIRVGYAAEQILKSKQQNHILDKLSAAITKTGEYIREPANPIFKYDWNIRKNPAFKKPSWADKNPLLHDIFVGVITALFSLIVGIILWSIDKQSVDRKQEQLQKQVEVLMDKVDSLTNLQTVRQDTLINK